MYKAARGGEGAGMGQDREQKESLPCQRKTIPWWNFENKRTQKLIGFTYYYITFIPPDIAIYRDFLVENEENNF